MITQVHSTTIVVSDQDAALDFYVNTLGWEKTMDNQMGENMRYITVAPPGATTQIALGTSGWFDGTRTPGGNTGIAFVAKDLDDMYATLSQRGVQFKEPVSVMPWGDKATWFLDPDGNEFFVNEGQ